jgi:heat shock protein HslJ
MKINTVHYFKGGAAVLSVLIAGLVLSACVGGASIKQQTAAFSDTFGREWKLTAVKSASPVNTGVTGFSRQELEEIGMGDAYTLQIDEERFSGKAAPNRYFTSYSLGDGYDIQVNPIAGTLMMSLKEPDGLKEREYFAYLALVNRWDLHRDVLTFYTVNTNGEETLLIYE